MGQRLPAGTARRRFLCRPRDGGFTLLELVVVVFIIALISSFAALSITTADQDREMTQELERIGYLLDLAAQEAIVQGRPMGVRFTQNSYHFLVAGRETWDELDTAGPFRPRTLPAQWRFELLRDSKEIPLRTKESDSNKDEPQVLFYSTGEVDPFELIWRDAQGRMKQHLTVTPTGKIEMSAGREQL